MAVQMVTNEGMSVLTRREREVLDRAAHGLTNAQIAGELSVSSHAVKFHLASVYKKLRVANRTEAAALYAVARSHDDDSDWS